MTYNILQMTYEGGFMVLKIANPSSPLDGTNNAPMSVQVARLLINEIKSGVYSPGQKMDSIRTIAKRLGVGRQTVLSAFEILVNCNYICCAVGRGGSFVNPELQPGFFYRIGFFLNRNNPMRYGQMINAVFEAATRRGWQTVLGCNFEEDIELSDWIKSKKDLDGVIITGVVDDDVLKCFKNLRMPYLLLGNYDLEPTHPQVGVDFYLLLKDKLSLALKKKKIKNICALLGPRILRNEREVGNAIEMICAENEIKGANFSVIYSNDGGFMDISGIMKARRPEALFLIGEHALAWAKYQEAQGINAADRPLIIVSKAWAEIIGKKFYDIAFDTYSGIENSAVECLIKTITNNDSAL